MFTDDVAHDVDLQARGVERVFGGDGDDNFHSAANVASLPLYLYGGGGDDVLTAGVSKDFLHGGKGNDVLKGGYRDDTYYFARGDGQDLIFDDFRQMRTYGTRESYTYTTQVRYSAGQGNYNYRTETRTGYRTVSRQRIVQEDAGMDVLEFGAGIVASDLLMQRKGEDLLIGLKDEGSGTDLTELSDVVRIKDWSNERNRIERFTFSDGTQLGIAGMMAAFGVVRGGAAIDLGEAMAGAFSEATLAGMSEGERLFGGSNSDVIYGLGGDDILSGKAGADKLYGGAGSDTYYFQMGDGRDTVHESGGASDRIVFGPDIGRDDIWLSRHGNDLILSILGVEDELVVANQFSGTISHRVESFGLSDGSHLDWSHTNALIHAMAAFGKPEEGLSSLSTQDRESVQFALNAAWVTTSV